MKKPLKIYLISRNDMGWSYDMYDSAVVTAESITEARTISPDGKNNAVKGKFIHPLNSWVEDIKDVDVKYLGVAKKSAKKGVDCSSFNAG